MKSTKLTVIVGLLLVILLHTEVEATFLKIKNNRYDDLVIAISPDIKQDLTIITKIQDDIADASRFLHEATRKRAYFGNVKILVPETWSRNGSWALAGVETFAEADIRIDKPHPSFGNNPYTYQPEGCGDPGKYIHLTEEYVLDKDGNGIYTWGPAGRTIVHEFSHLRYGVFDEYGLGTDEHPNFYIDDNVAYHTGCTDSIRGTLQGNCTADPVTKLPGKDCFFLGNIDQNTAKVSIMYDFAIKSVTTFCESDTDDPDFLHNSLAPNQQNKMCNRRGTWDVIKDHADFKSANPPVNKTEAELKPTFGILYGGKAKTATGAEVCGRPVVLVLDVSGSMRGDRQFRQTQTADKLIKDILPVGTKVGIVSFSSSPTKLLDLKTMSTTQDRLYVSQRLPSVYTGGTGIGNGLVMAQKMLKDAGELKEGRIVLITDGEENVSPRVSDVKTAIVNSGIRVHAVAYSSAAAKAIQNLTADTGGQYAYYSEDPRSTVLDSIIETLMEDISICNKKVRMEIMRTARALIQGGTVEGTITIDTTLGNDTMFVFTIPQHVTVDVTLKAPDGNIYSSSSREYSLDKRLNIVRFNFQRAKTGKWTYSLHSYFSGTVSLVVKALPGENPYQIESWLSSSSTDLGGSNKNTAVYVHVHKGYSPVMDADVTVKVERPAGAAVALKPLDNGILPDNLADDGVYSAYFTQFNGNERYSLDVDVRNIPGKTHYIKQGTPSYGGATSRYHNTTTPTITISAANFTRTTSPGAVDVTGYQPGKDNFAPSRVTDLKVVAFSNETGVVTLTWTAPGDDLDTGTASKYVIRTANNSRQLLKQFDTGLLIDSSKVLIGSLQPSQANTKERISIQTSTGWTMIYFALKTKDEANHLSDQSNIVAVILTQVSPHQQTTDATPEASPNSNLKANPSLNPKASPSLNTKASPSSIHKASPSSILKASPISISKATLSTNPKASPSSILKANPSLNPKASPILNPKASPSSIPKASPSSILKANPSSISKANLSTNPKASPISILKANPSSDPKANLNSNPKVSPSANLKASSSSIPEASPSSTPKASLSSNLKPSPRSTPKANLSSILTANSSSIPKVSPRSNAKTRPKEESNKGLDPATIIAIVCGLAGAVFVIAMVLIVLLRRNRGKTTVHLNENPVGTGRMEPNVTPSKTYYVITINN